MRRVLLAFLGLLLLVLIGATWYAYDKGFTRKWRGFVTAELRKRGVEVTLRRLTLDPFRGLVAKGVRVFDAQDRRRQVAAIDEMILQVNYANLIRGEPFLDALDLRDAHLSLPLDPANARGPKLEISRLNARLFLPLQQIYLARAEAEIYGVQVSASGRLINPQAFRPQASPATPALAAWMPRILEELKALRYAGAPPVLTLSFSGDLAAPEKVSIDLGLWGSNLEQGSYALHSVAITARYRDGVIDLQNCTMHDGAGVLALSGSIQPATRSLELRLRSTLDAQGFARAFWPTSKLGEFVFYSAPTIELSARGHFGEKPELQLLGHVALGRFAARAVIFESLAADIAWENSRWSAREVRLVHRSGELTGDVMQLPGDFRSRLKSTINPKALQPFATGKAAEIFSSLELPGAAHVELEARGPTLESCAVEGTLELGPGSFRGMAAERLAATVRYADRVLTLSPFHVQRAEGHARGGLAIDFARNEVHLEKIKASVHPQEVILWIEPKLLRDLAPYRFGKRPPAVELNGVVHTRRGASTRLTIEVDAPGGMDYTFLKKNLRAPKVAAKLFFTHDRLRISELAASLFGGSVTGGAEISLDRKRPGHRAQLEVEGVDFASLTQLYFNYDDSQGKLRGRYAFNGHGEDPRTMQGEGALAVTDGKVFAIPFLGPFSGILNNIVPGMGYQTARQATATFRIDHGVIHVPDLEVQAEGFSMFGKGRLFFLEDRLDFNMRINAQGLPGVLLFPVSKLFEYTSDELLSKPVWRPRALSRFGGSDK